MTNSTILAYANRLEPKAQALIAELHHKGALTPAAEKALQAAQDAAATKGCGDVPGVLSYEATLDVLSKEIPCAPLNKADAVTRGVGTGLLDLEVVADQVMKLADHQTQRPQPPQRSDPRTTSYVMPPDAKRMLVFNARDTDASGRDNLVQIVARRSPELQAQVEPLETRLNDLLRAAEAESKQYAKQNNWFDMDIVRAAAGLPTIGRVDQSMVNHTIDLRNANTLPALKALAAEAATLTSQIATLEAPEISQVKANTPLEGLRFDPDTVDVRMVPSRAINVTVTDFHDKDAEFGDPVRARIYDHCGALLGAAVKTEPDNNFHSKAYSSVSDTAVSSRQVGHDIRGAGPALDTTPVAVFAEKAVLSLGQNPEFQRRPGQWLDTPFAAFRAEMQVGRGIINEPGAKLQINAPGAVVDLNVPTDDAYGLGSAPARMSLTAAQQATVGAVMQQPIVLRGETKASDMRESRRRMWEMAFPHRADTTVGANSLKPLSDVNIAPGHLAEHKMKLNVVPRPDAQRDGVRATLTLEKGFVSGKNAANVDGYQVDVGYMGPGNQWVSVTPEPKVLSGNPSQATELSFDIESFKALLAPKIGQPAVNLEVHVYNREGVPATRMLVPFDQATFPGC